MFSLHDRTRTLSDKKNVCKSCYKYFIDWFQLLIDFKIWHLTKYIYVKQGKKVALEAFMNLCLKNISLVAKYFSKKESVTPSIHLTSWIENKIFPRNVKIFFFVSVIFLKLYLWQDLIIEKTRIKGSYGHFCEAGLNLTKCCHLRKDLIKWHCDSTRSYNFIECANHIKKYSRDNPLPLV